MKTLNLISVAALIGALSACSGGGGGGGGNTNPPPPATATSLIYTNPTSGNFQLVRDPGSTTTHLILDLVSPTGGGTGRGVGFFLNADASKITWSKVNGSDSEFVQNGAFSLGTGVQALKAKVNGNELQAGIYQKGTSAPALAFGPSVVLARIAMDLKSGITPGTVSFTPVANKAMLLPDTGTATPGNISINVGSLMAQ